MVAVFGGFAIGRDPALSADRSRSRGRGAVGRRDHPDAARPRRDGLARAKPTGTCRDGSNGRRPLLTSQLPHPPRTSHASRHSCDSTELSGGQNATARCHMTTPKSGQAVRAARWSGVLTGEASRALRGRIGQRHPVRRVPPHDVAALPGRLRRPSVVVLSHEGDGLISGYAVQHGKTGERSQRSARPSAPAAVYDFHALFGCSAPCLAQPVSRVALICG